MQFRFYQNIGKITVKCVIFRILRYSDLFLGGRYRIDETPDCMLNAVCFDGRGVAKAALCFYVQRRPAWNIVLRERGSDSLPVPQQQLVLSVIVILVLGGGKSVQQPSAGCLRRDFIHRWGRSLDPRFAPATVI